MDEADVQERPEDEQRNPKYHPQLNIPGKLYLHLSMRAYDLVRNEYFNYLLIGAIIAAGILVGGQTYPSFAKLAIVADVDNAVLMIFCFEIVIKTIGEGLAPWR